MRLAILTIAALTALNAPPAQAADRTESRLHQVFHYAILWPTRVVTLCICGPIIVPEILAERFDKTLENDLSVEAKKPLSVTDKLKSFPRWLHGTTPDKQ